jgi:hypothetical protein
VKPNIPAMRIRRTISPPFVLMAKNNSETKHFYRT